MQFLAEHLSAQPAGGHRASSAIRIGQPLVLGELTAPPGNSSLSAFSFVPCPARFLFDKHKKKMWGTFSRQSRAFLCRKAAPRCIPAAIRRPPLQSKENVGDILHGKAYLRNLFCGSKESASLRQSRVAQQFIWQKHHFFVDKIRNVYYAEKEAAGRIPASS